MKRYVKFIKTPFKFRASTLLTLSKFPVYHPSVGISRIISRFSQPKVI